jgi:bacteriocin biosynthesis cyclodehydratase domain-containing protein
MPIGNDTDRAGHVPARPLLKPWYQVIHTGDVTLIHYGRSLVALSGSHAGGLLHRLVPLLDGNRQQEEIAMRFPPDERADVFNSIELMSRRELLLDGPMDEKTESKSYPAGTFLAAALGRMAHPNELVSILSKALVGVAGSSLAALVARDVLDRSGIRAFALDLDSQLPKIIDQLSILVVAPATDEVPRLDMINRACLDARTPWIQILPFDGDAAVVGPIYIPWQTCCYECFRLRRIANSPLGDFLKAFDSARSPSSPFPPVDHVLAGLGAMAILRFLIDPATGRPERALSLQFGPELSVDTHTIYRVPRCPVCSIDLPAPSTRSFVPRPRDTPNDNRQLDAAGATESA